MTPLDVYKMYPAAYSSRVPINDTINCKGSFFTAVRRKGYECRQLTDMVGPMSSWCCLQCMPREQMFSASDMTAMRVLQPGNLKLLSREVSEQFWMFRCEFRPFRFVVFDFFRVVFFFRFFFLFFLFFCFPPILLPCFLFSFLFLFSLRFCFFSSFHSSMFIYAFRSSFLFFPFRFVFFAFFLSVFFFLFFFPSFVPSILFFLPSLPSFLSIHPLSNFCFARLSLYFNRFRTFSTSIEQYRKSVVCSGLLLYLTVFWYSKYLLVE